MTIQAGDPLPDGKLSESAGWDDGSNCPLRPADVSVAAAVKNRKIAIFGLPGAFTPTCSAKHVPSYLSNRDKLMAKGVSEIWCVAVNDGYVMQAWGRQEGATGKMRMLGDGMECDGADQGAPIAEVARAALDRLDDLTREWDAARRVGRGR